LSIRRNFELNLLVADPVTGSAMREMFARDLGCATRIDGRLAQTSGVATRLAGGGEPFQLQPLSS
jgi:hypothetical protein